MSDRGEFRSFYVSILDDPDFGVLDPFAFKVLFALKVSLGAPGIGVLRKTVLADQLHCSIEELERGLDLLEATKPSDEPGWIMRDRAKNLVWLVNGLQYEPSISSENAKHRKYVQGRLEPLGAHREIVKAFKRRYPDWFPGDQSPSPKDTVSNGYKDPIGTVSDHRNEYKRQATSDSKRITSDSEKRDSQESPQAGPDLNRTAPLARFLDRFYPLPAHATRRDEVTRQLEATLTEAGARLDRRTRVKAVDEAHLVKCVNAVLRDPPDKPDAAVVWVLKKLLDPILNAEGQTVTEAASARNKREDARLAAYLLEKRRAAKAWAEQHPTDRAKIEADAKRLSPAETDFGKLTRAGYILERIGKRMGFPSLERWESERTRERATA